MCMVRAPYAYQQLEDAEHETRGVEDQDSKESRRALLHTNAVKAVLATVMQHQVKQSKFYPVAYKPAISALGPRGLYLSPRLDSRAGLKACTRF